MTRYSSRAHFNNYDPSSFGWKIEPDLVPLVFQGVNFGQCARAFYPVAVAVLTDLTPLIPGGINFGPHDDWAYSATDELPDGSPSFHHYGIAFDLNWRENPMGDYVNNPDAGQQGAIPYAAAMRIARQYGCEYGGGWSGGANRLGFKDYMHFECHLPPEVARTVRPVTPPKPITTSTRWPYRLHLRDFIGDIHGDQHSHGGINAAERAQVRFVFTRLEYFGYWTGDIPSVFQGAAMADTVRRFKVRNYLHADSKVSWSMWNALRGTHAKEAMK